MIYTVKEAKEKLCQMPDDAMIVLDVLDTETSIHNPIRRIDLHEGYDLVQLAKEINYADNDYFGLISLSGMRLVKKTVIHNLIFPQKT